MKSHPAPVEVSFAPLPPSVSRLASRLFMWSEPFFPGESWPSLVQCLALSVPWPLPQSAQRLPTGFCYTPNQTSLMFKMCCTILLLSMHTPTHRAVTTLKWLWGEKCNVEAELKSIAVVQSGLQEDRRGKNLLHELKSPVVFKPLLLLVTLMILMTFTGAYVLVFYAVNVLQVLWSVSTWPSVLF